jgi:hypothetical protein
MATPKIRPIGIVIDKITMPIEHVESGQSYETHISQLSTNELGQIKKSKWLFDWKAEILAPDRNVYKLIAKEYPSVVQGLLSISDKRDHIFLNLIESSKENRGDGNIYAGVPANLFAFACKRSFESGYEGVVAFTSKTKLVDHYVQNFGAEILRGNDLYIGTKASIVLVKSYFKNFFQ